MTEYEYFIHLANDGLSADQADELWRVSDGRWEYLSGEDWQWHDREEPGRLVLERSSESLARIDAARAATLERDKHPLIRYWLRTDPKVSVYRQRRLPGIEEVFGRENVWGPTQAVSNFLFGRPGDAYDLTEIDVETAERVIRENRGVSEATEL